MAGNARFYVSPRDTDSTMPISPSSIIRLVPPEEKNGRLMPVLGMVLVTTAIFSTACRATCTTKPTTSSAPNRSGACAASVMPRHSSSANSRITAQAPTKPSSSHRMEKMKSFCGSGTNRCFWRLLPRPRPATNYQINSVAISNGGSIAALADVIYDQFRLPIDYYVTVDMQALVDMVDNFGGIEVYIPHDMSYGGSKLLKGYRNLNGASAEFFVRCRHGDGYANSDIDRLNMQRYFYAGLFKRARAMGVTDILNQLPLVFKNYIKTDMDISTIAKLVVSFLKLDSSNIILAQTPVFMGVPNVGKTDTFAGYSCVVPDAGSIANLLNQYFCTYTGPIDVSEMNLVTDEWPHGSASTDANVQYMGRIDKESDDAILSGETDLEGAVTTDGQAAGSAN